MQEHSTYKEALRRRNPVETFIVLARVRPEVATTAGAVPPGAMNPITVNWFMRTSIEPPLVAVSIAYERYSYHVVKAAGSYVVAAPTSDMERETRLFGTKSGRDMDKIAEAGTSMQPCTEVDGEILSDAAFNLECEVVSEFPTGDHAVFVGRVRAAHVNSDPETRRIYTVGTGHRFGAVAPE
jgi:flavin reductase (DIM6/NTAB) family NADH-FMN oxidoreductase RutF